MMLRFAIASLVMAASACSAQDHGSASTPKAPNKPSATLEFAAYGGAPHVLTPAELHALPHISVTVHNAHNNRDETYRGVPVRDLMKISHDDPKSGLPQKVSANMLVIVAGATDSFHVAITRCDIEPECRSGQAIVADQLDDAPLGAEGAFKLVLTEDKKPARWVRNLESLTEIAIPAN